MLVNARFERYGVIGRNVVALFSDVRDATGDLLTDHVWSRVIGNLARVELRPGALVTFTGRVCEYVRKNKTRDYYFDTILGLQVRKQGERRVPARVWRFMRDDEQYVGCKYYLDDGPRCYCVNVERNEWERIRFNGLNCPIPEVMPADETDREIIEQFIEEDWYGNLWATAEIGS